MADQRFFLNAGPRSLQEVIAVSGAEPVGDPDPARMFDGVAPLSDAGPAHVSFLDNKKYIDAFCVAAAGAVFVRPDQVGLAPEGCIALVTDDPYRAYALAAATFHPDPRPVAGVSSGAHVDPTAKIGADAHVAPGAAIGAGAALGDGVIVHANAVIGANVSIGAGSEIGPTASLSHCEIGARVLIHAGARIGQRGFGFAMGPNGHLKVPQLGRVIIGDDVEIGANTTIDRGAGPDTVIGPGCMIDNLVQIGHNVKLGRGCVVVAQAGIAGSTKLGDFVVVAAQGGLIGHLTIGAGARIAAQAGVMRDVGPGETVGGSPAMEQREWLKSAAIMRRMAQGKDR